MADYTLHTASPTELDATTLYRILRLRVDIFVVEQECPYPELDGRDLESDALWIWASDGDQVLGTLRILRDDAHTARIGRVVTASSARSSGLGGVMMRAALERLPGVDVVLDAQAHLEEWYGRFGFLRSGAQFHEDGIPHIPMRRAAG